MGDGGFERERALLSSSPMQPGFEPSESLTPAPSLHSLSLNLTLIWGSVLVPGASSASYPSGRRLHSPPAPNPYFWKPLQASDVSGV